MRRISALIGIGHRLAATLRLDPHSGRHRIPPAGVQRMATQQPPQSQPRSPRRPVRGNGLQRVARTRWMKTTVTPKQRAHIAPIRAKRRHSEVRDRPPSGGFNRQVARLCVLRAAAATLRRSAPRPRPKPDPVPRRARRCPAVATSAPSGTTRGSPASPGCGPPHGARSFCPRQDQAERLAHRLAAPPAKAAARTHACSAGQTPRRTRAGAEAVGRVRSGDDVYWLGAWQVAVATRKEDRCGRVLRAWLHGESLAPLGTSGIQHLAPIPSGHSCSKAVTSLSLDHARLVRSFHLASHARSRARGSPQPYRVGRLRRWWADCGALRRLCQRHRVIK